MRTQREKIQVSCEQGQVELTREDAQAQPAADTPWFL